VPLASWSGTSPCSAGDGGRAGAARNGCCRRSIVLLLLHSATNPPGTGALPVRTLSLQK
jgi:hypothetical protein